jgi:hypothetical protein
MIFTSLARPLARGIALAACERLLLLSLVVALGGIRATVAAAQDSRTVVQAYGHIEMTGRNGPEGGDGYFTMGEHSLFVTSPLNSRFSYLGEFTVRPGGGSSSGYVASIERALVRYQFRDKHALIAGKVHSPVNYWNDAYHHGRVFFPVIDRPLAFSGFIPLHTLGAQLQGQNLGPAKFGYDLMAGNGIASSDTRGEGTSPAVLAAFHLKPLDGLRIGASVYHDVMEQNGYGAHSGHGSLVAVPDDEVYVGRLEFSLASTSIAYFGQRVELLHEWNYNWTRTDSLGRAGNHASFVYAGVRVGESFVPFITTDNLQVADNDLHTYPIRAQRRSLGFRWEFSPTVILKAALEHTRTGRGHSGHSGQSGHSGHAGMGAQHTNALRLQFAYGF